jgi:metal-responsive CopG/Arc/MetJ family transcriptional regulator
MSKMQRVTITLPADILERARAMSAGNLSQFISDALRAHFEDERLRRLRDDLIAAAIAKAEEDLETAEAFRYAEDEAVARYVPPYFESEEEEALTVSPATSAERDQ